MSRDGLWGEDVAAHYDESAADMFDAAVLDPMVDFLAAPAPVHGREHFPRLGVEEASLTE